MGASYAIAEEYIRVMYKLFESSWRDDAGKQCRYLPEKVM